jgi:hypothetical protein
MLDEILSRLATRGIPRPGGVLNSASHPVEECPRLLRACRGGKLVLPPAEQYPSTAGCSVGALE